MPALILRLGTATAGRHFGYGGRATEYCNLMAALVCPHTHSGANDMRRCARCGPKTNYGMRMRTILRGRELRIATMSQLARKHDHSDAEGVLLRSGARDPEAETWPGGVRSAPVSSALDADGSRDVSQQEPGAASPASDSMPQRGAETESEHSFSQTGESRCPWRCGYDGSTCVDTKSSLFRSQHRL